MSETLKLTRERLGSIDLATAEAVEMSSSERKEYCAAIFAVFPRLERDLKHYMYQQLLFSAKEAGNWEQVVFGRGVFEGIAMLLDHWQIATREHIDNSTNSNGGFDEHSPINEI